MTTRQSFLLTGLLFFLGWLSILGLITYLSDDAPAYMVVFPDRDFLDRLPGDVALVNFSAWTVSLISDRENFAHLLYKNGATLVLPAGLTGCAITVRYTGF